MKPLPFSISDFKTPAPVLIKEGGGQPQRKSSNTGLYIAIALLVITNAAWVYYIQKQSERTAGIIRGLQADVLKQKQLPPCTTEATKQDNQILSQKTNENGSQSA